jgi:hypothetical protein
MAVDIKARRSLLGRSLRREISDDYIVVTAPDHPLLLKGPDILIGGDGNLTAVYLPTIQEINQNRLLRARYILARLALPASTRHLLVQPENARHWIAGLSEQFALELPWDERREVVKIARDANFRGKQRDLPRKTVIETRERFAQTYLAVKANQRLTARIGMSPSVIGSEQMERARLIDYGPVIDGVRENYFDGEALPLQSIKSLIDNTINESFSLEDTVPLQRDEHWRYDVAAVSDVATFRGDPEKTLRAAAFAGWALLENLPRDLQSLAANHLRKRKKYRAENE